MREENKIVSLWRCVYPIGIHFIIANMVSMLGITVISFIVGFQNAENTQLMADPQAISDLALEYFYSYSVFFTALSSIVVIPILYLFYKADKQKGYAFPLTSKQQGKFWVTVAVLAAISCITLNNILSISRLHEIFPGFEEVADLIYSGGFLVEIICLGVIVPIAEELLFRGIVYQRIKSYISVKGAAVLSALLFGLYHMNVVQGIYAFMLGLLCAYSMEKGKSLFAPILFHMSANIISVILTETVILDFLYMNDLVFYISTAAGALISILLIKILGNMNSNNQENFYDM